MSLEPRTLQRALDVRKRDAESEPETHSEGAYAPAGLRHEQVGISGAGAEAADRAGDAALGVDERAAAIGAGAGARDDEGADSNSACHDGLQIERVFWSGQYRTSVLIVKPPIPSWGYDAPWATNCPPESSRPSEWRRG